MAQPPIPPPPPPPPGYETQSPQAWHDRAGTPLGNVPSAWAAPRPEVETWEIVALYALALGLIVPFAQVIALIWGILWMQDTGSAVKRKHGKTAVIVVLVCWVLGVLAALLLWLGFGIGAAYLFKHMPAFSGWIG